MIAREGHKKGANKGEKRDGKRRNRAIPAVQKKKGRCRRVVEDVGKMSRGKMTKKAAGFEGVKKGGDEGMRGCAETLQNRNSEM